MIPSGTMHALLEHTYYGNTLLEWLTAAGVILGTFIVVKVVYFVFSKLIRRFTEKTKTTFDDVLVDLVEAPIVTAFTIVGLWIGLRTLTLPKNAAGIIDGASLFCVVICITWLISRVVEAIFREFLEPLAAKTETDLDDQLLPVARKGSKLIIWSLGTIVALNNAGYDVGAVLAGLGIGGIALAMAAKDTVANIFGGVTVFADRPFAVHDRIRIDEYDGFVREIGIRSTRIQTMQGPIAVIPNSRFSDSAVENVSAAESLRTELVVGLTYDTEHAKVHRAIEILREIIGAHEKAVLWEIGFETFADFSLNVRCAYHVVGEPKPLWVQSEINLQVLERFNAEGLEFAFPTRTLHMAGPAGVPEQLDPRSVPADARSDARS